MPDRRHFRTKLHRLSVCAVMLVLAIVLFAFHLKDRYENLVVAVADQGLAELQKHQDLQRELSTIHLRVARFMAEELRQGDEQRIYLESKEVASLLDFLIQRSTESAFAEVASLGTKTGTNIGNAIASYRSAIILSFEMLTVNPGLQERHLARAAQSLSQLNIALARSFEERSAEIQRAAREQRSNVEREILILIAALVASLAAALAMTTSLARSLVRNFADIDTKLNLLGSGVVDTASPPFMGDGEFRSINDGLRQFRNVLAERNLANAQMDAIFNSVLEAIVVSDATGRIIQNNAMADTLFAYERGALVGKNIGILMAHDIEAEHDRYLDRFRDTGTARIIGKARSLEGKRSDGSMFPIQLAVSLVELDSTKYFVGVISDITELRRNEQLLHDARDAALASAQLKAEFLATMSHEIRTPMNGILGMAQLLHSEQVSNEERRKCTEILLGSSRTLITLLNDILDLSKIEAGQLKIQEQAVTPWTLAKETAALFAEAAAEKELRLLVEYSSFPDDAYMMDPVRIRQMLSNLVGNAIKFTAQGEIRIELRLVPTEDSGLAIWFQVSDTGPGIAAEDVGRLFEKYSQLDSSPKRRHGGSGLGLSIVRQFAGLMRGKAGVESTLGEGSKFWFWIPAVRAVPGAAAAFGPDANEKPAPPERNTAKTFSGRVLIAEDIAANRLFLELALKSWGLVTVSAEDGRKAIEAFTTGGPFDCIFMDMRMPEMDGEEAARAIRQWESRTATRACPIVAVTANAFEEDRHRCLDAGMNDFLAKPLKIGDLQEVLERWLDPGRASLAGQGNGASLRVAAQKRAVPEEKQQSV